MDRSQNPFPIILPHTAECSLPCFLKYNGFSVQRSLFLAPPKLHHPRIRTQPNFSKNSHFFLPKDPLSPFFQDAPKRCASLPKSRTGLSQNPSSLFHTAESCSLQSPYQPNILPKKIFSFHLTSPNLPKSSLTA